MNCPQCEFDGRGAVPYGRYKDHCDNCAAFEHGREAERVLIVQKLLEYAEALPPSNGIYVAANLIKDQDHFR